MTQTIGESSVDSRDAFVPPCFLPNFSVIWSCWALTEKAHFVVKNALASGQFHRSTKSYFVRQMGIADMLKVERIGEYCELNDTVCYITSYIFLFWFRLGRIWGCSFTKCWCFCICKAWENMHMIDSFLDFWSVYRFGGVFLSYLTVALRNV